MNLAVAGLYSLTLYGLQGSLITSLGHGLTSSALFCSAGFLYDRTNSRNLFTLAFVNLFNYYPVFSTLFFILILANCSFPGTLNFIGECLSIISLSILEVTLTGLFVVNILLTTCYSLFLYKRSCCKILLYNYRNHTMDVSRF
jgi:NADH-quinone oxidoreductase subunit M